MVIFVFFSGTANAHRGTFDLLVAANVRDGCADDRKT
jgi:hypothetical protein